MDLRSLVFEPSTLHQVLAHLRSAPERVAFLATDADTQKIVDSLLMFQQDVHDDSLHAELTDEALTRFFQWAARHEGAVIEAHSHLGAWGDPAQFSATDIEGFRRWVPHVRWRTGWRPYAALVVGPTTFDGLFWSGAKNAQPRQIERLETPAAVVTNATTSTLTWKAKTDV